MNTYSYGSWSFSCMINHAYGLKHCRTYDHKIISLEIYACVKKTLSAQAYIYASSYGHPRCFLVRRLGWWPASSQQYHNQQMGCEDLKVEICPEGSTGVEGLVLSGHGDWGECDRILTTKFKKVTETMLEVSALKVSVNAMAWRNQLRCDLECHNLPLIKWWNHTIVQGNTQWNRQSD